jgi:Mn-dependent DtxR family transcriptional regulator
MHIGKDSLRFRILSLLAFRQWAGKSEKVRTKDIAKELSIDRKYVNDECEAMDVLGWIKVKRGVMGDFSISIEPKGELILKEVESD